MAEPGAPDLGAFDRDTAVELREVAGATQRFDAVVADGWRAGRGPHGGYLAAMLLRALTSAVADPHRAPRSLTIHYARAPEPGPVSIAVVLERAGRSLSTLSARMEQHGRLIALALAAFSVPWSGPEISDLAMPQVAAPDPVRKLRSLPTHGAPSFAQHITFQPRLGGMPFTGATQPMEIGGWVSLAEARPLDALSIALFADALIPAPFMRVSEPNAAPTIDLTVHFRASLPRAADPDPDPDPEEMCLLLIRGTLISEGFFEEDGTIWASDGTVLAQSRQLALLLPFAGE